MPKKIKPVDLATADLDSRVGRLLALLDSMLSLCEKLMGQLMDADEDKPIRASSLDVVSKSMNNSARLIAELRKEQDRIKAEKRAEVEATIAAKEEAKQPLTPEEKEVRAKNTTLYEIDDDPELEATIESLRESQHNPMGDPMDFS